MDGDVRAILELLGDRALPGETRLRLGDWVVRADRGATGRANSCWPTGDPGLPLAKALERVEEFYETHMIPTLFQVYGGDGEVAGHLRAAGYQSGGGLRAANLMVADVPTFDSGFDGDWDIADGATDSFRRVSADDDRVDESVRTNLPQRCVTLLVEGEPAGAGLVTIDGEWAGVFLLRTDPDFQRRGIGEAVMAKIVDEARLLGAVRFWLQVMPDNEAAGALYRKAGFTTLHSYRYFARPPIV